MTFRRAQSWVWWLLPFLVARALMPVGFMAQAVDGEFKIVFCTAGYNQHVDATGTDESTGTGIASAQNHDTSQNDFSCPFAQVAAAPLLDLTGSEKIEFVPVAEILPLAELPYYAVGPPRFIATRGPPALS